MVEFKKAAPGFTGAAFFSIEYQPARLFTGN
jgi:hypothetical protein